MWDVTLAAFSDELVKIGASVDALQKAYGRLGVLTPGTRFGAKIAPGAARSVVAAGGAGTVPRPKQLAGMLGALNPGATAEELKGALAPALEQQKGLTGKILIGKGGGSAVLTSKHSISGLVDNAVGTPDLADRAKALGGPGQRAVNIATGLHEGYERGAKNIAPMHSHMSPDVIAKEHNLLRGMTGAGSDEARSFMQGARGGPIGEGNVLQDILRSRYGEDAAKNFAFGSPGAPKITKAMRKDLARNVGGDEVNASMMRTVDKSFD